MFISFLYMFRATMCPLSGETTVFMRHLVCRVQTRQSSIQDNKYQVSHKYRCFSWWWAHSRPKHVEKRNKHAKKNCAASLALFARLYRDAPPKKKNIKVCHICLSVRPSAWNSWAPTGWLFMKFNVCVFSKICL